MSVFSRYNIQIAQLFYGFLISLSLLFGLPYCARAEDGLLVHYAFDEGTGTVVHDRSGQGHDGAICGGATWATGLPFNALSFNGKDSFVEGPKGLVLGSAGTLEVWCYPRVFGGGLISWHYEHPATPKPLSLFFDVYTYNSLLGVMSDWKNQPIDGPDPYVQWNAALTVVVEGDDLPAEILNRWSHIVMTYDAHDVRIYRNGVLQASKPSLFAPETQHVPIRIGVGYAQGLPYFDGMIAETSVYTRALSETEIAAHFAQKSGVFHPKLPYALPIVPRFHADLETLVVETNLAGLDGNSGTLEGQLLSGATVLHTATQPITAQMDHADLSFPTHGLLAGDYDIHCTVSDANGATLVATSQRWRLPKLAAPGVRALNNLVAELLDANDVPAQPARDLTFSNPRGGFVFISCAADLHGGDSIRIAAEGAPEGTAINLTATTATPAETMCFLPEGVGTLHLRCDGTPVIRQVIVRAIPELMYCGYPTGAGKVPGYGPYDFAFLQKDVLPNINTIVASGGAVSLASQRWTEEEKSTWSRFHEWKNSGRRWLHEYDIPSVASSYDWKNKPLTGDEAFDWVSRGEGFTDPDFSGFVANEFGLGADTPTDTHPQRDPRYRVAPYTEALRRFAATSEYKDKLIYIWCGGLDRAESRSKEFVDATFAAGGKLATEEYLAERPTEGAARDLLYRDLRKKIDREIANVPGLPEHLILVPSILSAPPESDDVDPHVDYKVWMDLQMRYMATAPELFGLAGIMWYKITYSDEEAVRWMGRLYRHYAIEGQTKSLSEIYGYQYKPGIIQNADFDDGLNGWTIHEAEPGSVRAETLDTLSYHEGRRMLNVGNHFLLMKRSASGPNTVAQTIRNLSPGKVYSVKMLASDYEALQQGIQWTRKPDPTNTRLSIANAETIAAKSFVSGVGSERSPQWFDFYRTVFRAQGDTATVTIADWPTNDAPGGPIGQELAINFIEVQPYFE